MRCRAHPRSRGENYRHMQHDEALGGSSPLTRGKPVSWRIRSASSRLIPAHAGKTTRPAGTRAARQAHPRSRGENAGDRPLSARPRGSSPLTRGKLHGGTLRARRDGLIPAHAGKTILSLLTDLISPAHPRSRGENGENDDVAGLEVGSSPLTRGKLWLLPARVAA